MSVAEYEACAEKIETRLSAFSDQLGAISDRLSAIGGCYRDGTWDGWMPVRTKTEADAIKVHVGCLELIADS
jgi:hypothetical protein